MQSCRDMFSVVHRDIVSCQKTFLCYELWAHRDILCSIESLVVVVHRAVVIRRRHLAGVSSDC